MADTALQGIPKFDNLEVVKTGIATVGTANDGTTTTETVPHNLGYAPAVLAFVEFSSTGILLPLPLINIESSGTDAGKVYSMISCATDSTNLYIYNQSQLQGTAGGPVRYYLLKQTSIIT